MIVKTNFKEELKEILKDNNLTLANIKWVGTRDYKINKELFLDNIDFYYDSGTDEAQIVYDLIIAGDGFHLERHSNDFGEWFEFKKSLVEPKEERYYTEFKGGPFDALEDINYDPLEEITEIEDYNDYLDAQKYLLEALKNNINIIITEEITIMDDFSNIEERKYSILKAEQEEEDYRLSLITNIAIFILSVSAVLLLSILGILIILN